MSGPQVGNKVEPDLDPFRSWVQKMDPDPFINRNLNKDPNPVINGSEPLG